MCSFLDHDLLSLLTATCTILCLSLSCLWIKDGVVYKIPFDCDKVYDGETGRSMHKRILKQTEEILHSDEVYLQTRSFVKNEKYLCKVPSCVKKSRVVIIILWLFVVIPLI